MSYFAVYPIAIKFEFLYYFIVFLAAKTALNTFLFSKEASQLEKDLIKSLKVSLPAAGNLHVAKILP